MPALPPLLNVEDPAEAMRRAAKLMRERAQAAPEGPWSMRDIWGPHVRDGLTRAARIVNDADDTVIEPSRYGDDLVARPGAFEHIAWMHPGVALAVADWLDFEAVNAPGPGDVYLRGGRIAYALTVACAYLGEGS